MRDHLLAQNAVSKTEYTGPACWGDGGLKCPVGALLKEEVYSTELEGVLINDLLKEEPENWTQSETAMFEALRKSVPELNEQNMKIIAICQEIHDQKRPSDWPRVLKMVSETLFEEKLL